MNQSKVYFIIGYFHIFKHSKSSLSILKVSNIIIYNTFISKWHEWLLIAILPFRVLAVRNNTLYHSVQTEKPATFWVWKNVTLNSQMPNIVFAVLTAQWKLICTKAYQSPQLNKKTYLMNKIPALHGHTILSGNLSPTNKSITKILGINNDYSLKQPWSPWNLLCAVVMYSSFKC